jgi:hypothetical protein
VAQTCLWPIIDMVVQTRPDLVRSSECRVPEHRRQSLSQKLQRRYASYNCFNYQLQQFRLIMIDYNTKIKPVAMV